MKHLLSLLLITILYSVHASDSLQTSGFHRHWGDFKEDFHTNRLYCYWGYNRAFFSLSDITFHGPGYRFTIYDVSARDRPSKLTANNYLNPVNITVPQYNGRLGFYIKHNVHLTLGIDHMKYVMVQNQTVKMSGIIDNSVSDTHAGVYYQQDKQLTTDFLRFEHTNGLNLVSVDGEYLLPIYHTRKDILHIGWNFGIGGLFVITKTEVHLMGFGLDNRFHLSGLCFAAKTGPRIDLWRYFFIAFEVKGGYMDLPWVPIMNEAPDRASHHFSFLEYYGVVGLSYKFNERRERLITKKIK